MRWNLRSATGNAVSQRLADPPVHVARKGCQRASPSACRTGVSHARSSSPPGASSSAPSPCVRRNSGWNHSPISGSRAGATRNAAAQEPPRSGQRSESRYRWTDEKVDDGGESEGATLVLRGPYCLSSRSSASSAAIRASASSLRRVSSCRRRVSSFRSSISRSTRRWACASSSVVSRSNAFPL